MKSEGCFQNQISNSLYLIRQLYGSITDVVVPEMYVEQTTGRVLTMEWIEVNSIFCLRKYVMKVLQFKKVVH